MTNNAGNQKCRRHPFDDACGKFYLSLAIILFTKENVHHFNSSFSYRCTRSEDGGHASLIEEVVVLGGNHTSGNHHDVFTSQTLQFRDELRDERLVTCGKAFRRSLWAKLQFPLGYWYEDSVISQILLPMARRIYAIDAPVFAYLLNPQGVSAASQGRPKSPDTPCLQSLMLFHIHR